MLLASLQSQHKDALPIAVDCLSDDSSRHLAHIFFRGTHVSEVRSSPGHGQAQTLCLTDSNVSSPFSGSLQQSQVHTTQILNNTIIVRLLHDHAGNTTLIESILHLTKVGDALVLRDFFHNHAMEMSIGIKHFSYFRVDSCRHQYGLGMVTDSTGHHRCLSRGCGTVVHRRIAYLHVSQSSHHCLIFKDIVEGALRDLGLIGRVARQIFRTLYDLRDDRGNIMVIDTCTGEARQLPVVLGKVTEIFAHFHLAHCFRHVVVALEPDGIRDIRVEVFNGTDPYVLQHFLDVFSRLWKIFKHSLELLKYQK